MGNQNSRLQHPGAAVRYFSSWITELGSGDNTGEKCCAGRKSHLDSSAEIIACVFCKGNKNIQCVLEKSREGESVTERDGVRKTVLGSHLTPADQRPNLHDIARRWPFFLALVSQEMRIEKKCLCLNQFELTLQLPSQPPTLL